MDLITLTSGELVYMGTLEGLYFQDERDYRGRKGWYSHIKDTTRVWWWDEKDLAIVREGFLAMAAKSDSPKFTCKYCGGHNG